MVVPDPKLLLLAFVLYTAIARLVSRVSAEVKANIPKTTAVQFLNFASILPVCAIMMSRGTLGAVWEEWVTVILILSFTATPVLILYLRKFKASHWLSNECMMFTTFSDFYCWTGLLVVQASADTQRLYQALYGLLCTLGLCLVLWVANNRLPIMREAGHSRSQTTLMLQVAFVIFAISEQFHLSIGFLALLVGITTPKTIVNPATLRNTIRLMECLLVPFVFVQASKYLTFSGVSPWALLVNTLISVLSKSIPPLFFYCKQGTFAGMLIGSLLSCRGFIAMVAAQVSRDSGMISDGCFTEIVLISLITTLLSPIAVLVLKPYCPQHFDDAKPQPPIGAPHNTAQERNSSQPAPIMFESRRSRSSLQLGAISESDVESAESADGIELVLSKLSLSKLSDVWLADHTHHRTSRAISASQLPPQPLPQVVSLPQTGTNATSSCSGEHHCPGATAHCPADAHHAHTCMASGESKASVGVV